jgi:hypothetical protein
MEHLRFNTFGDAQEILSRRGKRAAGCVTVEQSRLQAVLKCGYASAERCMVQAQLSCGGEDLSAPGHRQEDTRMIPIHLAKLRGTDAQHYLLICKK